jgi:dihydropteroate synthase
MRPIFQWNLGKRTLELGRRTLIMGVVNVTPDSFSDGGLYLDRDAAIAHGMRLAGEGADILDVGGESTRPGASVALATERDAGSETVNAGAAAGNTAVNAEEEIGRVVPVIAELKRLNPAVIISVDTYKASVARAAVEAGAEIVNDVSGFCWDAEMAETLAGLKCGAILMHTRGRPEQWRRLPPPEDVVGLVRRELKERAEAAIDAGIERDRIVLDPGFGFGKKLEENYPLLAHFDELRELGFPLLGGVSRKSFIGRMLARDGKDAPAESRLYGSLAAQVALILKGADIIRTHDVEPAVEAARVADVFLNTD